MSQLLQGVPLRTALGEIYVTSTGGATVPDHWHNGLPYEADGALCISPDAIDHWHQGLPFTSGGRLVTGINQANDHFGSGAAPFDVASQLSTNVAAVGHIAFGVAYSAANQVNINTTL